MQTTTITKQRSRMPTWVWFVVLWCAGVGGAVMLGEVFKVFMDLTLFAAMK